MPEQVRVLLSVVVLPVARVHGAVELEMLDEHGALLLRLRRIASLFDGSRVGCFARCGKDDSGTWRTYYAPLNLQYARRVQLRLRGPRSPSTDVFASFALAPNTAVHATGVYQAAPDHGGDPVLVAWTRLSPSIPLDWFFPLPHKWALQRVRAYAERERIYENPAETECLCEGAAMREYTREWFAVCSAQAQQPPVPQTTPAYPPCT
jgi:hypothetical protein